MRVTIRRIEAPLAIAWSIARRTVTTLTFAASAICRQL
jgi:hypothetical protein